MPELPEVETVRRELAPALKGRIITGCSVLRESYLRGQSSAEFVRSVSGKRIEAVERRGKYLLFRLSEGIILAHLGMTGVFRLVEKGTASGKHTVARFEFERFGLAMDDVRRFGRLRYYGSGAVIPAIERLGAEPLNSEFSADYLADAFVRRRRAIKELLLDQSVIAGLGNIYVSEILYRAGIHPSTGCQVLSRERLEGLVSEIRAVLGEAIECCGTTISDYKRPDMDSGGFQDFLRVYGKAGEECPVCGAEIQRMVSGGRSSFYCPRCQRCDR